MKKRIKSLRSSVIAGAVMVAAIAVIVPASALAAPTPVTIGGPTAAAWVASGATAGITVGLTAVPANEGSHPYSTYPAADDVFDAPDRDTIGPGGGPFGLGVDNTLISNSDPGVTSKPSEIGYYGTTCESAVLPLEGNCADELRVTLGDKSLQGGSFKVTFLYGPEQLGESLRVALYWNGDLQNSSVYGPVTNGSYPETAGDATFNLPNVRWDEIRFIGDDANVADATDFLVESISGVPVPELGGDTATGSGAKISSKGSWFMFNSYPADFAGDNCVDVQAGNPKLLGANIVGEYCIVNNLNGTFTATYDIDDTITIGGFEYKIVVVNEHLSIKNTNQTFTGSPGTDDNADFDAPFTPLNSQFKVFAHFELDYV